MIFRIKFYYSHNNKMSVSQQSVLGSSQNLIASHVAGCNPPTLKNSIIVPSTATEDAPYFPSVSGALYTIPAVLANATICLPHVAVAKGYQFDFVFSATETKTVTFTSLTSAGVKGAATTAPVITGNIYQTNAAGTGLVAIATLSDRSTVTANFAVLGDKVSFMCDGADWFVHITSNARNDASQYTSAA
jgi:hypothetical protein